MTPPDNRQAVERLVGQLFDGSDPKAAAAKLCRLLRKDPALAERYAECVELHALLEARHATTLLPLEGHAAEASRGAEPAPDPQRGACGAEMAELWGLFDEAAAEIQRSVTKSTLYGGARLTRGLRASAWLAVAGCLLAVAYSAALFGARDGGVLAGAGGGREEAIGVLSNASGAAWGNEGWDASRSGAVPRRLVAGQELSLQRGVAELTLTSGVVVVMRGPAELDLLSPMRVRARRGAVRARVGESARGFVLETPTTEVTDLGTEFGVDVDQQAGTTDVVVFEGRVDLQYVDRSGTAADRRNATRRSAREDIRLLRSGEGLRVDPDGATSRIVSIHADAYPASAGPGPLDPRPPLIRRVWDNLRAPQAAQYYQISRGGLREEARAYVDRFHQWNGLKATGIPAYLLGADYVQTFNADKWEADVEIRVELAAPARLYVMFDRRLDPPAWLTDNFADTGDKIGVDEDYRRVGMARGGFGPAVSIDTVHDIWVRDVPSPRVVTLGALPMQELAVSMYGIAATPLDTGVARGRPSTPSAPGALALTPKPLNDPHPLLTTTPGA
ncbi:FecR domain-containing protein [Botrimarina sp.]|uniref:FecR domain-containing protein n=1 Tax=Botrimarina sp. TaxID=2795802 RepID=UPI0032ED60E6